MRPKMKCSLLKEVWNVAYSHHTRASRMKNYIKLKLMSLQHREINTAHDNIIRISKVKAQLLSLINHNKIRFSANLQAGKIYLSLPRKLRSV